MRIVQLPYLLWMKTKQYKEKEKTDMYFRHSTMEITTRIGCKIACRACPQSLLCEKYGKEKPFLMNLENFKICIDKLPKNCKVIFSGLAEPFLNPDCADMILYAHQKGYELDLYTTLVGVDGEIYEKIKNVCFHRVILHIPDDLGNAKIKITEEYLKCLDLFLELKKADGTDFVTGFSCHGFPPKEITRHLKKYGFCKIEPDYMIDRAGNLRGANLKGKNVTSPSFCGRAANFNHNVLLPDGRVVLCCMDFGLKHVMGNLLEESYLEIMKRVKEIKNACQKGEMEAVLCKGCTAAIQNREITWMDAIRYMIV